jgi:small subunit ribosomal protein S1
MSKEIIRSHQFAHAGLIQEENLSLNPEQSALLASLYENLNKLKQGQLIDGTILKIDNDGVLVDINYKSYGHIPSHEFSPHELKKLKVGSPIEVILDEIEGPDGLVVLSYEKAKEMRAWDLITKHFEEGTPVEGVITHKVKGGLSVDIGVPAFLPGSQVDINRVMDFDQFVGQTVTCDVIKINRKRNNVILSRRKYLTTLRTEARKNILESLSEGSVVQGVVKNITNYGAFVDIGGVDGLLHITDMTWGRIAHPSELVKIGETITVKVLSIDKENAKISLGMKQLTENPWQNIDKTLAVGSHVQGTISSITDYGLFVEIQKGVEGLVHISEISWTERISDLRKHYAVGEKIEVLIVSLDKENRRMSLSIKQLEKNPWESLGKEFSIGQRIKGTISNITDFGIFVTLKPGIDGLIHISDLSWTEHINHPTDLYKKGQEIEAVILGIDEANKKVSLGIKQLNQDPWEIIENEYPRGTMVEGTVSKITNFGAFVKLPSGVEGLVHVSELADKEVNKVEDVLHIGEKRTFRVINANKEERKLGLSLKTETAEEKERASKKEFKKPDSYKQEKRSEHMVKPKSQFQLELEKHLHSDKKKKRGE